MESFGSNMSCKYLLFFILIVLIKNLNLILIFLKDYCRMCESIQEEIQTKFRDAEFTSRTIGSHQYNVAKINQIRN